MCVVVQMGDQFFNFRNLIFFSLYTLCMCTIEMASICLLFFCKISFYRIHSNSFSFCRSFSNGSRKLGVFETYLGLGFKSADFFIFSFSIFCWPYLMNIKVKFRIWGKKIETFRMLDSIKYVLKTITYSVTQPRFLHTGFDARFVFQVVFLAREAGLTGNFFVFIVTVL